MSAPSLDSLVDRAVHRGRASGALVPIETSEEIVRDGGIEFAIRIAESLRRKERARVDEPRRRDPELDPFSPWEEELFVSDVGDRHVALLNKFPVLDRHLLLVTRRFEHQDSPLDAADFDALARALVAMGGLGFYNGGTVAGASQKHKHLQLVPLPLTSNIDAIPIDVRLRPQPDLPFRSFFREIDAGPAREDPSRLAARLFEHYRDAVRELDLGVESTPAGPRVERPYNLLATRRWLLVVPRRKECVDSISVNALGFAGSFFVRDAAQRDALRRRGPLAALAEVAVAP